MTTLEDRLKTRIRSNGPMPVSAFMAMALGDPKQGYYQTRDPLGAAGDFTTSPEISQIFGELVGMWLAVAWRQAGSPRGVRLAELGPGRGTLMADILRAARFVPDLEDAISVHLVETSPVLRAAQESTLTGHGETIDLCWHDSLSDVPDGPLLLIANEFFDALPIEQLIRTEDGWRRRMVSLSPDDQLVFGHADADDGSQSKIPDDIRRSAEIGSIFEFCPAGQTIMKEAVDRLASRGIAALIIDYGHVRPGAGDTLQAVKNHKFAPVLETPGEADLTTHVDFSALANIAAMPSLTLSGPEFQGIFLTQLGISERTAQITRNAAIETADQIRAGTERLIAADGMGQLFKVMAVTRSDMAAPPGFLTHKAAK